MDRPMAYGLSMDWVENDDILCNECPNIFNHCGQDNKLIF